MKLLLYFAVFLVVPCAISLAASKVEGKNYWETSDESDDREDDSSHDNDNGADKDDLIERQLRSLGHNKRGAFDCNQRGDKCKGIIPCCGTLQCYWPAGYSAFTSGHCVDCVQRTQICQRDSQCCSPLACHKGSSHYVDGQCGDKRYTGAECHDDDQCVSGDCNIGWTDKIKGYGGKCT